MEEHVPVVEAACVEGLERRRRRRRRGRRRPARHLDRRAIVQRVATAAQLDGDLRAVAVPGDLPAAHVDEVAAAIEALELEPRSTLTSRTEAHARSGRTARAPRAIHSIAITTGTTAVRAIRWSAR